MKQISPESHYITDNINYAGRQDFFIYLVHESLLYSDTDDTTNLGCSMSALL